MDSFLIQTIRISRYKTKWIGPLMLLKEKRKAFQAWEFPHEPILWVALYEHSNVSSISQLLDHPTIP